MSELVIMEKVNKFYGDLHVLKDITTTVARGEVVVIIGPSGSCKSTLCRAISNRLETIDAGVILIDGEPLPEEGKELARLRADVGMVFQSFNLFAHKTALENVTLGPIKVRNMKPQDAREKATSFLLERVGVAPQAYKQHRPSLRLTAAACGDRPLPCDESKIDSVGRTDQRP